MSEKDSPKDIIDAYRKQQARSQKIYWFTYDQMPTELLAFLSSDTPTATVTITPSPVPPTFTPTNTPTEVPPTNTATITPTPTISGPFIYIVEEGDVLFSLAEEFDVEILVLLEVNQERLGLDPSNPVIKVGDELLIPPPGTQLSTPTPLPEGLPRGTKIVYSVQPGDSLAFIALEFNSTVEDIIEVNELEDANSIYVGQVLEVRVNLVTPVPTEQEASPTVTPTTGG